MAKPDKRFAALALGMLVGAVGISALTHSWRNLLAVVLMAGLVLFLDQVRQRSQSRASSSARG